MAVRLGYPWSSLTKRVFDEILYLEDLSFRAPKARSEMNLNIEY